jgi:hypothetical protein
MDVSDQLHASADLPSGKEPLDRLDNRAGFGAVEKERIVSS